MAKPALPPPPPPLVPQQILRKANPSSPKRPSRKRKPDALQNTETEHSNHPRDQREEKHDRHKIKVPRAINLTLSLQNQQNDSRMVSQQDSNQEGSTSFNVIHSSENFQVADPEYYDNGKSERESSDNLSSTATDAESFGQIKDAGEIANKKSESRKKLELLKAKLELAKQKKLAMQGELKQTNPTDSESPKISEAKKNPEVQAALKRAREKLRGALTSRERALQRTSPVQTPISGLCVSLIIRNISQTGPQSLVRFTRRVEKQC